MKLTTQQEIGFAEIELRVVLQRAIELIDDLNFLSSGIKNKTLKSQLKAIYEPLEKETKKYNDLFEATQDGTTAFYNITKANYLLVMRNNLIDKNLIVNTLLAHEKDSNLLDYTINKILKKKN